MLNYLSGYKKSPVCITLVEECWLFKVTHMGKQFQNPVAMTSSARVPILNTADLTD